MTRKLCTFSVRLQFGYLPPLFPTLPASAAHRRSWERGRISLLWYCLGSQRRLRQKIRLWLLVRLQSRPDEDLPGKTEKLRVLPGPVKNSAKMSTLIVESLNTLLLAIQLVILDSISNTMKNNSWFRMSTVYAGDFRIAFRFPNNYVGKSKPR